jgi:hypothetical protein
MYGGLAKPLMRHSGCRQPMEVDLVESKRRGIETRSGRKSGGRPVSRTALGRGRKPPALRFGHRPVADGPRHPPVRSGRSARRPSEIRVVVVRFSGARRGRWGHRWWHPDTQQHFKYWGEHCVPHICVLHYPQTSVSCWVHVTPEKVIHTGKGAKILVTRDQSIDDDHLDALLGVATEDLGHPGWEGSSWNRRAIARHDRLRFALLTPRLIAPHPNLLVEQYAPDEAIAALIEMRHGRQSRRQAVQGSSQRTLMKMRCVSWHRGRWKKPDLAKAVAVQHAPQE